MTNEAVSEGKLVYFDSEGRVRALRGVISVSDGLVIVRRSNGEFLVPLSRVIHVERWDDSREGLP